MMSALPSKADIVQHCRFQVPGLAVAAATKPASVMKPREGDAITTVGWIPIKLTGAKARMASYGSVL